MLPINFRTLIANVNKEEEYLVKKETIKTIISVNLLMRNTKQTKWINIYNNFQLEENLKCDLYFENLKSREVIIFKLIRIKSKSLEKIEEELRNIKVDFLNKRLIIIETDLIPENVFEIDRKIKQILK